MPTLYTIGHSNHTLQEFLEMLDAHQITHLVDIRTLPKSRHVPWFNQNALRAALLENNIAYTHLEKLGGLRHTTKDSINRGWKNASFCGFADYMQTKDFFEGLKELNQLIKNGRTAIMCAEAVPWRCHRSLIADVELARNIVVMDIMNKNTIHKHKLTPFAVIDRNKKPIKIYYPKNNMFN